MTPGEYIRRTATLRWEWGVQDCTIWVADWCIERWGIDPAAAFRGSYGTEAEAEDIIFAGLANIVSPAMYFLREKDDPESGDVGIIKIKGRQVSAIRNCGAWWFRTPRGVACLTARPLIAWGE